MHATGEKSVKLTTKHSIASTRQESRGRGVKRRCKGSDTMSRNSRLGKGGQG